MLADQWHCVALARYDERQSATQDLADYNDDLPLAGLFFSKAAKNIEPRGLPFERASGIRVISLLKASGKKRRHRPVGTRKPDAVIAPRVDYHVILRRHMAVDALRAGAARQVMMVRRQVEFLRQVALRT